MVATSTISEWDLEYEALAGAQEAAAINQNLVAVIQQTKNGIEAAAATAGYTASVTAFATPTAEQATPAPAPETPVNTGRTASVAASQADSSATVFILGAVAFVVLFVAVLVPTLCRHRIRRLLGLKGGNQNLVSNASSSNKAAEQQSHDWDVDSKAGEATMGLTKEEAINMGVIQASAKGGAPDRVEVHEGFTV